MSAVTADQVKAIHAIAKAAQIDDGMRRAIIADEALGKTSSRDLTQAEAGRVIERLKAVQGALNPSSLHPDAAHAGNHAQGHLRLDGPWAGKLRALWISGYHLGVVRDRRDTALRAFCERQTGIAHPNWWREPADARRAIEALKKWLAREGGVQWPRSDADVCDIKQAVIVAQVARLRRLGVTPLSRRPELHVAGDDAADLDDLMQRLGSQLRRALRGGESCPGHVASASDPKVCGRCGTHIDSLRPPEDEPCR